VPRKFLAALDQWLRPRLSKKTQKRNLVRKNLIAVFVDEKRGRELNKSFRQKNYATDVLSFAPIERESAGELVFCMQVLKSQAKEHRLSVRKEIAYLYIHGFLHLLGYDHEKSKRAETEMFTLQDSLFNAFLDDF
jgi:probable rRNA maturation factor